MGHKGLHSWYKEIIGLWASVFPKLIGNYIQIFHSECTVCTNYLSEKYNHLNMKISVINITLSSKRNITYMFKGNGRGWKMGCHRIMNGTSWDPLALTAALSILFYPQVQGRMDYSINATEWLVVAELQLKCHEQPRGADKHPWFSWILEVLCC